MGLVGVHPECAYSGRTTRHDSVSRVHAQTSRPGVGMMAPLAMVQYPETALAHRQRCTECGTLAQLQNNNNDKENNNNTGCKAACLFIFTPLSHGDCAAVDAHVCGCNRACGARGGRAGGPMGRLPFFLLFLLFFP